MDELRVRDVAIPCPTNVKSGIQKSEAYGMFELKQSMVQILHINGQFLGMPHEDIIVHNKNFFEISDTYIPSGVNVDY